MAAPCFRPGSAIRWALLGMALLLCLEVNCLAGSEFAPLPANDASRTYPNWLSDCRCPTAFPATRRFERVLIIVLENSDYEEAIADRYLRRLTKRGAYFTNFHALFHPSYSNYLAMVSGKKIHTIHRRKADLRNVCSIADLLESKGLEWKNYAQGYPGPDELDGYPNRCATEVHKGKYVRRHVPFMSFSSIQEDDTRCSRIVAASQFEVDRQQKALPAYAFYTPDLDNNGHDTSLQAATRWLEGFLDPLLDDETFMKDTLVVVTFDESENNDDNRIYTVFLGGMVKSGKKVKRYCDHFSVLRTIEENFGLCPMGEGDGGANPIVGVWK